MHRLPEIYQEFVRDFGDVAAALEQLGNQIHGSGPLDNRARRIAQLAIAVGAESEGAVRSHVRRALKEGLSRAEVEHIILLSLTTVGFPRMIAALKWSREIPDS